MNTLESVLHFGRDADERQRRASDKRAKVAERIAARQLTHIQAETYASIVRGGRFGLDPTMHDPDIYELVAQRLLEERVEIKVHEISQKFKGEGYAKHPVRHVVSVATLNDWPKHIEKTPTQHPEAFVGQAGPLVGADVILVVDQIYPPQPTEPLAA
jgi:hypothetical protein